MAEQDNAEMTGTELVELNKEAYKYGFTSAVEAVTLGRGLSEDVVRAISAARNEPQFMLDFRLKAFHKFKDMPEPEWAAVHYPPIDYQACNITRRHRKKRPRRTPASRPTILSMKSTQRCYVPSKNWAFPSTSKSAGRCRRRRGFRLGIGAHHAPAKVIDAGVIFCSFSEALHDFPQLIERYLGTVVPIADNYFAALNSAVFSDGSFVYIPPYTKCPLELSTYFRINNVDSGQFERTLIIADEGSYVSYLEGCTAPQSSKHQLHAAVVELVALDDAEIKYSTVQNWFAGDQETGEGGVYNFVTKRGACRGKRSKISWSQV